MNRQLFFLLYWIHKDTYRRNVGLFLDDIHTYNMPSGSPSSISTNNKTQTKSSYKIALN